ncbi:unnamed protein product [Owenia fusiformis]|uniref:Ankyrin repeat domain-containing protein n=1 Tax=Owenia fusiformis TaxID=6347 RepID=A0A8S4NZR1_OWEFU|nr:unnamed protein product [Owenia fusiformis]
MTSTKQYEQGIEEALTRNDKAQLESHLTRQHSLSSDILLWAFENNIQLDTEIVQLLIENGANINACDQYGWTVLMGAASMNQSAMCLTLIELGADVNARVSYGQTALVIAAQRNHLDCCCVLIEHGADVNATDQSGKSALMFAVEKG